MHNGKRRNQVKPILAAIADKGKYYKKYRSEMIHGKLRKPYIVGDTEGPGVKDNCYKVDFSIVGDIIMSFILKLLCYD